MPNTRRILSFYLDSPKDLPTGGNVQGGYYLRGSADPVGLSMLARVAPTGSAFIVDILADGVSLLDSRVLATLPAGQTRHRSTNLGSVKAPAGSWVTLSLVQVGNKEPGQGVTIELEMNEALP